MTGIPILTIINNGGILILSSLHPAAEVATNQFGQPRRYFHFKPNLSEL